jgi:UDP-N-acetylmuramate: L-alanyl-gamma-D-glutamyl-meso-diaminopimelate ligase
MRLYILGICGTFMGGIARLARQLEFTVGGCDAQVYPPMSTQLAELDVELHEGYAAEQMLRFGPDLVIIGNALSRGNPCVEAVLNNDLPYTSGAQWLAERVLQRRWVLAVSGTHGKTTTASLLAWILDHAGLEPGFLIGGVPENFGHSARLGSGPAFVVEADEYDTAFFDKRSKFVHYHPRTLVLNNLEFDHADIFKDLDEIKTQFHHLVRTVPGRGCLIVNGEDANLAEVMGMGYWSDVIYFAADSAIIDIGKSTWLGIPRAADCSRFDISNGAGRSWQADWRLVGRHNMLNALAAIAAAHHAGVSPGAAVAALPGFASVKRRLELIGDVRGIKVYDDFAHHPTAIKETLAALRARVDGSRIVCLLEPRSNSMRMGAHRESLAGSLAEADRVLIYRPESLQWDAEYLNDDRTQVLDSVPDLIEQAIRITRRGDHIVIMSNGAFGGIHQRLLQRLRQDCKQPVA